MGMLGYLYFAELGIGLLADTAAASPVAAPG